MTSTKKDPVLVVLQLAGGNDALNTIVPYNNNPAASGPTVLFPEPPTVPPVCPKCGNDDPGEMKRNEKPISILCKCSHRFQSKAGWMPYLREFHAAQETERQLRAWGS